MSATGRGSARNKDDYYVTPAWCVHAIAPYLSRVGLLLDPCAGDGAILAAAAACWPGRDLAGVELDEGRAREMNTRRDLDEVPLVKCVCGDALDGAGSEVWHQVGLVLANPPYSRWMEFAKEFVSRGIEVAFLLRLGALASQRRAAWWRLHPCDVYVLPRRPSFTGHGTDAADYGWFVWGPGRGGRLTVLDVEACRRGDEVGRHLEVRT